MRGSNALIAIVNFVALLISIAILGGGIWLAIRANSTDCLRFLQWPLIIIGLAAMVVSFMGCAGACYGLSWLLRIYQFALFVLVLALLFFIVFAYAVTDHGQGQVIINRRYLEYQLSDYSGWLKDRVRDRQYWNKIVSCIRESHVCSGMHRYVRNLTTGLVVSEPAELFYQRHLTPIQSGCCKPPTSCGYTYVSETVWNPVSGTQISDLDCLRWSNDQKQLCYSCNSCKAGVLASIKRSWRKVSVLNIVVLVILVIVFIVGCAAYRNARRANNNEAFGVHGITRARPGRFDL